MSPLHKSKNFSKFNRNRRFDREKYSWKRNRNPTRYDRHKVNENRDFLRNCDRSYPLGSPPQNRENAMNRLGVEIISPNCKRLKNYDSVSPRVQNSSRDIPRNCDAVLSHVHSPRCSVVRNPRCDFYLRKSEADSLRFRERRSELDKTDMNPTSANPEGAYVKGSPRRELSRKPGSISPRFRGRFSFKPEERSFANVKSTHGFSRKFEDVSCKETKEKSRGDSMVKMSSTHKRKFCPDSPRGEVRNSKKIKNEQVENMNPGYNSSRKCADFAHQVQVNTSEVRYRSKPFEGSLTSVEKSEPAKAMVSWDDFKLQKADTFRVFPKHCRVNCKEDPIMKKRPNCEFTKICDVSSPRVGAKANENSKEDLVEKVDESCNYSTKYFGVLPQVQATSEVFKEAESLEVLVKKAVNYERSSEIIKEGKHCGVLVVNDENFERTDANFPHKNFKIRKVNAIREFPKHCGALAPRITVRRIDEVVIDEANPWSKLVNYSIKGTEPRFEVVGSEDVVNEVLVTNDDNYKHSIEILKEGKPSDVLVANDGNYENTDAKFPHNNFKRRKVNAIRKFPKHCGALAPRVTVRRIDEVVIDEADPKSKHVNNSIKGIEPRFQVVDLEQVVNEVKADNVDKVLSKPVLAKYSHKVSHDALLINDVDSELNEVILTNASLNLEHPECAESFDVPKDHFFNHKEDVVPLVEQSLLDAEKSLDCEGQENRNGKCRSPVHRSGHELPLFENHQEETCSDLLPNRDKIKALSIDDCETVRKQKQVRETIESYSCILAKLLEDNKTAVSSGEEKAHHQAHIEAAMILKREQKWVNMEQVLGHVPGIEVGDKFKFRAELVCIGLHRMFHRGIDYMRTREGKFLATSIVDSGRCVNDAESSDVLVYCGIGGNPKLTSDMQLQDEKLERGNLALKNSMEAKTPVRVIRKATKSVFTYYYDGLYVVTKVTQERSLDEKLVYKFHLERIISGKPNIISQVEKLPFLVEDISLGKEKIPIRAVNTVDDEQFPTFNYIAKMTYPDSCYSDIFGCACTDCYSDSKQCRCSTKNGGEAIFKDNGTIIVKPKSNSFIYECGPSCKCPSSCKNRVSQYGIQCQLEVFRTNSMGWGVRSPDYIPAGSFICEYVGELLQDREAEQRTGNDEYLFQIDKDGFTIDGEIYGNVGRFINHSCSPNLYAQNVLYDHGNKRMPHVMFFAMNGIFPFQELTYDYNYKLDKVLDSKGNIMRKACHCGSRECTGRLY